MSTAGFVLTSLTLAGAGVPDAEVTFKKGLNVIVGASNTGKTFIAQCINYALGGGDVPKQIQEAASYEKVLLGLRSQSGDQKFVLERALRGGDVRVLASGGKVSTLGAVHKGNRTDTISHFLLSLSGLAGRKIRTNQQGETRPLSFRDLARLALVSEEDVISERSPVHSGQFTKRTEESAVFRLLLTGIDDSSVIAAENPKITQGKKQGKAEVIETLLARTTAQLEALNVGGDVNSVRLQLETIEAALQNVSAVVAQHHDAAALLEERRRTAWTQLREVDSRVNVLSELQHRFQLLVEQYQSDLRRLESISEAGIRLGQMKEERCPVCGALSEHHSKEHRERHTAPEEVAISCHAEAQKLRLLLGDLHSTMSDNNAEILRLQEERRAKQTLLDYATLQLREEFQPRLRTALQGLQETQSRRDAYRSAVGLLERIEELSTMLTEAQQSRQAPRADGPATTVGADQAEEFSKVVEALLRAWRFPALDRVTFSETDQDVVISGQRRSSHGKGVRAITHAAFNLALLRYCYTRSMPHPGLVLIDSPLIVYRQPDEDEVAFTGDVKEAFYHSLAESFGDAQVIILENDAPPRDLVSSANIIQFTGAGHGRQGFIPKR